MVVVLERFNRWAWSDTRPRSIRFRLEPDAANVALLQLGEAQVSNRPRLRHLSSWIATTARAPCLLPVAMIYLFNRDAPRGPFTELFRGSHCRGAAPESARAWARTGEPGAFRRREPARHRPQTSAKRVRRARRSRPCGADRYCSKRDGAQWRKGKYITEQAMPLQQ